MKTNFLILVWIMLSTTFIQAQDIPIIRDTLDIDTIAPERVLTNHFFENIFIGGGFGGQIYYGDHNGQADFIDRVSPSYNIYIGKWFTPGIGIRIAMDGTSYVGLSQSGINSTGKKYDKIPWEGYWLYGEKFSYWHLRSEVLLNATDLLFGNYNFRKYSAIGTAGVGWIVNNSVPNEREISATIGIINTVKASEIFDVYFETRTSLFHDRFDGEIGNRRNDGSLSCSFGVKMDITEHNWDRPKSQLIKEIPDYSQIQSLNKQIEQIKLMNDSLTRMLIQADTILDSKIMVEYSYLGSPLLVTFNINSSKVSKEARVNLGYLAKLINNSDQHKVFKITGYADKGTGSASTNNKLSRRRAEAVRDILIDEFYVDPARLRIFHQGGVSNMFYDDPKLSRAVISVLEDI